METSENSDLDTPQVFRRARRRNTAFSLVEIALALGILGFSLVSVFGLIPLGLASFRKASDISIGSQISQVVIGEAQQTDFDTLINKSLGSSQMNAAGAFTKTTRYFDNQGQEQTSVQPGTTLYWVNTRIVPSTFMPGRTSSGDPINTLSIATVTVQVATNPGNHAMTADEHTLLWTSTAGTPIMTFSTYVARNSPPLLTTP